MRRTPTNFGVYELEDRLRHSRLQRLLRMAAQLLVAVAAVVLAGLFLFPARAHAGRACTEAMPGAEAIVKGMVMAQRTAQQLDASGAIEQPPAVPVVLAAESASPTAFHLQEKEREHEQIPAPV